MFKYIFKTMFLLAFISFIGCQKDSEEFVPVGNNITVQADIFGIVSDDNENPIEGASVLYKGEEILTDEYGIYKFEDVKVDSKHNFLNITKNGYFEGTRTFRANHSKTIQLKTQLLEKKFDQSFSSNQGGVAIADVAELKFGADAIMYQSNNAPYDGTVKVAMKYIDPTTYASNEQMPGDLSALNASNILGTLQSYGMVYVELQSPSGEKLQIREGKTVEMAARIPLEAISEAPSEIPMWYFDDGSGLWIEEGKAVLESGRYIANVSHFSCWNYDYFEPSIVLSGRVVDQNGNPLGGVHVWVSKTGEYLGGHGNADADGTFSGQVPKDVLLDFKLFNYNGGCGYSDPFYITQIGPFSIDTDLGDIAVTIIDQEYLNVTGVFNDCDGNLVTNGFVKIDYHYYELTDGTLDASIITCNNSPKYLIATDRDNFKSIEPIQLTSPGDVDLGVVSVCEIEADHILIKCDALGFNETLLDSIYVYTSGQGYKGIQANEFTNGSNTYLYMNFEDFSAPDFVLGTFDITQEFEFGHSGALPNTFTYYSLNNGQITITEGGGSGDRIKGSFTFNATSSEDNMQYDFYGSFQVIVN